MTADDLNQILGNNEFAVTFAYPKGSLARIFVRSSRHQPEYSSVYFDDGMNLLIHPDWYELVEDETNA